MAVAGGGQESSIQKKITPREQSTQRWGKIRVANIQDQERGAHMDKRKIHELKCWPIYFEQIQDGNKTFELRYNDRSFQVGDIVILHEFYVQSESRARLSAVKMESLDGPHPSGGYTGRYLSRTITYIMVGPIFGLSEGWVILGLK